MSEPESPGGKNLYRGPAGKPRDKRERERDRQREGQHDAASGQPREQQAEPRVRTQASVPARVNDRSQPHGAAPYPRAAHPQANRPTAAAPRTRAREIPADPASELPAAAPREQRIHGLNACLALFAQRPEALRKVWLLETRIPKLKQVLAHCVKQRLGYTIVEAEDLERLSGSAHHEGVVFGALPAEEWTLSDWLLKLPPGPAVALWLDGVGNPHNLGAMLRSAAHFGAAGVLLPKHSEMALSGAAARVSEGAAERVPMVRMGRPDNSLAQLTSAGFVIAATLVRGGTPLYSIKLPQRLVLVMGAEQLGVGDETAKTAGLKLGIPGTGQVDSLNVSAATAVILGEWWRQHRAG